MDGKVRLVYIDNFYKITVKGFRESWCLEFYLFVWFCKNCIYLYVDWKEFGEYSNYVGILVKMQDFRFFFEDLDLVD